MMSILSFIYTLYIYIYISIFTDHVVEDRCNKQNIILSFFFGNRSIILSMYTKLLLNRQLVMGPINVKVV